MNGWTRVRPARPGRRDTGPAAPTPAAPTPAPVDRTPAAPAPLPRPEPVLCGTCAGTGRVSRLGGGGQLSSTLTRHTAGTTAAPPVAGPLPALVFGHARCPACHGVGWLLPAPPAGPPAPGAPAVVPPGVLTPWWVPTVPRLIC